jgi:uracil-DNA glycosylase family 4
MNKSSIELKCEAKGLKFVGGTGPSSSPKIMIIGESLGKEEEARGEAFVGGAGWLLDSILGAAKINRRECYITNVVKVKPPKNKVELLPSLGLKWEEFVPLLREEIKEVNPNIIFALGNYSLMAVTGEKRITKWRGSIIPSVVMRENGEPYKVVSSIHPAGVMRVYKQRPLLALDAKRVRRESEWPEIKLSPRHSFIEPSFQGVVDYIKMIRGNKGIVASDIEVDKTGLLSCLGISDDPSYALCIPFRNGYNNYWSKGEELSIWKMLREMYQDSNLRHVFQNALFDLMWMVPKVGYFEVWMDTMWAHQLMYAEIPKGLDTLCSIYTDIPYYKDERKVWKDTTITRQLWQYNCKDAYAEREVAGRLVEELKGVKQEEFFFGYVMKLLPVLLRMQMRGILVDKVAKEQVASKIKENEAQLEVYFRKLGVMATKTISTQKLAKLLYEEMGLPKQYDHKSGALTTGKKALAKLKMRGGR